MSAIAEGGREMGCPEVGQEFLPKVVVFEVRHPSGSYGRVGPLLEQKVRSLHSPSMIYAGVFEKVARRRFVLISRP